MRTNSGVNASRLTAVDLFSGCGGVTCGLKQAGFRVLGAVENEPLAARTYALNHPEVELWERDIRRVTVPRMRSRLGLQPGQLDLLAGCPPCQGFSSLRTFNGGRTVIDKRNDLVFQYVRFALGLRPRALMFENVPGLADDVRMAALLRRLERAGYCCQVAVLDAADYGVPQRRRRMVLLAGLGRPIPFAPAQRGRKTVAGAIRRLPPPERSRDPIHNHGETRSEAIRRRIAAIPKPTVSVFGAVGRQRAVNDAVGAALRLSGRESGRGFAQQ